MTRLSLASSRVSAPMTLFVMACGAVLALGLRGRLRRARHAGQDYAAAGTRLYAATSDCLDSMKIAKGYGAEERHATEFARFSRELGEVGRVATEVSSRTSQWLTVGSACLLARLTSNSKRSLKRGANTARTRR